MVPCTQSVWRKIVVDFNQCAFLFKKLTKNGRPKKVPTKKFRKRLDEKIRKKIRQKTSEKICDRKRKLGQGMVAAGARHG